MFISNSPRLFAGNHVLLRLSVPRHSPYALFRLNSLACSLSRSRVTRSKFRSCLSFANNCLGCNEKTVLSNILHHCFPPPGFPPTANCSSLFRKDLLLSSKLQLSVRFFPYSVFNEQSRSALRHPAGPSANHTPHYALMRERACSHCLSALGIPLRFVHSKQETLGGLEWTRTTDLPLIRRVL